MTTHENIVGWVKDIVEGAGGTCLFSDQDTQDDPPAQRQDGLFLLVPVKLQPRVKDLINRRNNVTMAVVGCWSDTGFDAYAQALDTTNNVLLGLTTGNNPTGVTQITVAEEAPITSRDGILQITLELTFQIEV